MGRMNILLACEESQAVCKEFRKKGHNAYSCDILPAGGGYSQFHLQCDVREVLKLEWDMIIAFPPCTHLAVSGAKHFAKKRADGRQQEAIDFFMLFANHPCPRIAIENPVGIMSNLFRKPDQIVQPWMFGDPFTKTTCLWLKWLPELVPTNVVDKGDRHITKGGNSLPTWYNLPPGPDRAKIRSTTFPGFAKAMAEQWS